MSTSTCGGDGEGVRNREGDIASGPAVTAFAAHAEGGGSGDGDVAGGRCGVGDGATLTTTATDGLCKEADGAIANGGDVTSDGA